MKPTLTKISRVSHKWAGVYVSLITLIWIAEMLILPRFYAPPEVSRANGLPVYDGQALDSFGRLISQTRNLTPGGVKIEADELIYRPALDVYVVVDKKKFLEVEFSAKTNEAVRVKLNSEALLNEKSILGWLHPSLKRILSAPLEILVLILIVTGLHLTVSPGLKKRKNC